MAALAMAAALAASVLGSTIVELAERVATFEGVGDSSYEPGDSSHTPGNADLTQAGAAGQQVTKTW